MKKSLLAILFVCAWSISVFSQSAPPFRLKEADGSPSVLSPTTIIVSNGSLSCTGKTCTLSTGAGGGGTVTSVSVTTANGVSGSVTNPATTPAITLTLGAITPTSITNTGAINTTVSSANAWTVGPNGTTNPTLNVVTNIASAATGLSLTGRASGTDPEITVLSPATNQGLKVTTKGTGDFYLNQPSNAARFTLGRDAITSKGNFQNFIVGSDSLVFFGSNLFADATGLFQRFDTALRAWAIEFDPRSAQDRYQLVRIDAAGTQTFHYTLDSLGDSVLLSGGQRAWSSSATDARGAKDAGLARQASAVIRATNGSTGAGSLIIGPSTASIGTSGVAVLAIGGSTAPTSSPADEVQLYVVDSAAGDANAFIRNEAGAITRLSGLGARVSTQFDSTSDTTLSDIPGLVRNVEAGRTYGFVGNIYTTSNIAGGVKAAVAGTATATSISYECVTLDAGAAVTTTQSRATALATACGAVTAVTAGTVTITGTIVVNAAGTLTLQAAQNASNGTATSVLVNSNFKIFPID